MSGDLLYGDSLATYGDAHISFNTYANSFYEAYWVKYTDIAEINLTLVGEGRLWCKVFREAATGGCALIGRHLVDLSASEAGVVRLPVKLVPQGHGHGGRIFVDLEVLAPSRITSLSWCTHARPRRDVSLGVGICTFNRESFVVRTAAKLLSAPPAAAVAKVALVNQGRALESEAFAALRRRGGARLAVYEQGNYGGAGGFARAATELLKHRSITHILFMDDDIELDARHLVTTAAFLRFARTPLVVGGHMLDLFRPSILYEAGNTISPDNLLHPNHHNRDLIELSSLSALSRAVSCHFNGWWYAAIPAQCFRDFGLPSPIFIRGDDLEFGTRLHRAGIETVSLPPVSVWHEPFYAKPPGWQLYYDFRNRLIFASLYEGFALDAPSRLLKLLMVHLIRYDYQQAWFMITALEDFLKGPELLNEGLPAIHERMTQGARPYAPGKLMSAPGLQPAPAELPTRPGAIRQRMLTSLARVFIGRPRGGAYGLHYTDAPLQWVKLAPSYVLSDRAEHFFLHYSYSRASTWTLARRATRAIRRYAKQRRSAAQAWKAAFPGLVTQDSWRSRLGLDQVRAPQAVTAESGMAAMTS